MKHNKLQHIRSTGFKTPDGYFESFEDQLLSELNPESPLSLPQTHGFKIPDGYFDTINTSILDTQVENKTKVIPLFSKKHVIYASSIAAAVLLLFNLSIFENKPSFDTLDTETVESYIDSHLSSYEMAALLADEATEEDLEMDYPFEEDHIEEYLLNNADIQTLILE